METEVRAVPAEAAPAFMVTEDMIVGRDWGRNQVPVYRVSEVAKVFFGMSESWLRLKLRTDDAHPQTWFVLHGQRMDFRRKDPGKTDSERVFLLSDIEPMAWSLRRFGVISPLRFAKILRIVEAEAYLYELLAPISAGPGEDAE
jgi:hypothetical protein